MEQKDDNESGVIENEWFLCLQAIVKRSLEILENKVKNEEKDKNAKT